MQTSRPGTLVIITLALTPLIAAPAHADPVACQREIVKRAAKLVQLKTKQLHKCEDRVLTGKSAGPCPDAQVAAKIAKAESKLRAQVAKRCGGNDRTCGTADDTALATIGWDVGRCPSFAAGACDGPIAACDAVADCVACIDTAGVDQALALYYGALAPTGDAAVRKCQRALGKEGAKLIHYKSKALRKCWDDVLAGKSAGPCPDARASAKTARAAVKLVQRICTSCGGPDKTCGTGGDDLTPAAIGFPATCPDVTTPGGAACGGPIGDLSDLVDCVRCVSEFDAECMDAAAVPGLVPFPLACGGLRGQLIDSPVDGVRYSTDAGATLATTSGGGVFQYVHGDTVTFLLGGIDLGAAAGAPFLLPDDILPTSQAAVNLARFLLTLDADRDPQTGVTIAQIVRDAAAALSSPVAAWDVPDQDFEASALADFARTANGDGTRALVSRAAAELELACSRTDVADGVYDGDVCTPGGGGIVWTIADGPNECSDALVAFFAANAGDVIEFGTGAFQCTTTFVMAHKEGITIRGQGIAETILDFHGSFAPEGISLSHMDGITIEDLTIIDTPGFSLKISDSDHVVLRNLRTMWSSADSTPGDGDDDRGGMDPTIPSTLDVTCIHAPLAESTGTYVDRDGLTRNYVTDSGNGGYAIYPVLSNNVLIDNAIALGASDAGIYVGQSNDVIVKNSEALFNVAGYEIENTDRADMFDNVAHCNTGGFLIFDLPGLNQYGDETRAFDNYSGYNNTPNFAPGGIVSAVPHGVGFLQLGYDQTEIFGNVIEFNHTVGLVYVSHVLLDGNTNNPDKRMDLYPEGMHVHDNTFTTNGTLPAPPEDGAIICLDGTGGDTGLPCVPVGVDDSHDSLLPALIQIKSALALDGYPPGTAAHIVWDGILDLTADACDLTPEFAAIVDARGKPQYTGQHHPTCRYNKYKFTDPADPATRRHPEYWSCITDQGDPNGNTFSPGTRPFLNFKNTDPTDPPLTDIDAHDCPGRFGTQLAPLAPAVVEPYVPGAGGDTPPNQAEVDTICADYSGSAVNRAALQFNCRFLSQYNLFADPTDPRLNPHEGGLLFDLTTPLFSDYAVKYRFLFLPPGERAQWQEGNVSAPNAALDFPVGTVIAKTFAFPDGADEHVVETRLLMHRQGKDGATFWEGMAFIWETDGAGNRTDARLAVAGGTAAVTWNYTDRDPDVTATYVGSTPSYAIPHANQCGNCHINEDREPGDAPIGPKVRLLNRPMDYGSGPENQLQHWIDIGVLAGAPTLTVDGAGIATNAQRSPRFNVPGDAFNLPTTEQARLDLMSSGEIDQEMRARAWFESNCAHCHNRDGLAQSTGVFLDVFRRVDLSYGVCKSPTTAGSSSGGRNFDIVPGSALDSIVSFRLHSKDPSSQMPPLARSVAHDEAVAVVDQWIDTVIDARYQGSGCEQ
jgi:parallel beta-helix repeat protein